MVDPRRAYNVLLRIFLRQARDQWGAILVTGVGLPLVLVAALNTLPFAPSPALRSAVIALGGVAALLGVTLLALPVTLARMREGNEIGFFAGLPVGQGAWLASLLSAYGVAAGLSMLGVGLIAMAPARHIVPVSLWAAPLVALAYAALAGLGACIGLLARTPMLAVAVGAGFYLAFLVGMLLFAFSPQLPTQTRLLAALLPTSLASDALAACLPATHAHAMFADLALLLIYAVGYGYIALRLLPWRVVGHQEVVTPKV